MAAEDNRERQYKEILARRRVCFAVGEKSFMGRKRVEELMEEIESEEADEVAQAQSPIPLKDNTMRDIDLLGVEMGVLFDGTDFLIDNGFPDDWRQRSEESMVEIMAMRTALMMGLEDHKPLIRAETRTAEQNEVMQQNFKFEKVIRRLAYQKSSYFAVLGFVIDAMAEAIHVDNKSLSELPEWEDISDACAYLNRYYFAIHKEIDPVENAAELPKGASAEIRKIVGKVVAYKNKHGGGYFDSIAPCFHLTGVDAEKITEITQQACFGIPLSKAWREQGIIAAEGAAGREINVGKKTSSGAVIVQASISGKDGKALSIDEVQKGVQRAIGNLIYEAGGKSKLPIIVTPQQIYRAYARLPLNATVSPQQAEEMERAMDVLMYAPASLNFTAQLEKHKHIKQQPDYDYQGEQSGRLSGTLVQAQKLEAEARDGSRSIAYKIYDVPVLYLYSHVINQMAWVPNELLTGGEKPPIKTTETRDAKGTARNIAMKENILTRVLRMKERQKKEESFIRLIRVDEVAEDCGIVLTDKIRRTLLKNMALYLDELQAQKQIKGYSEKKEGRKIAGYTVNP